MFAQSTAINRTSVRLVRRISQQPQTLHCKLIDICPGNKSRNVKLFTFTAKQFFSFKPGQFLSLHIPGCNIVGGYSVVSPPYEAMEKALFKLAIKYSNYPPTVYMYNKSQVGTEMEFAVGGNFYYDTESKRNLLLIAGGAGINPLFSILQEFMHYRNLRKMAENAVTPAIRLLYSIKTWDDVQFHDTIDSLMEKEIFKCTYFITQQQDINLKSSIPYIKGRINKTELEKQIQSFPEDSRTTPLCYICGPLHMITHIHQQLLDIGIPEQDIYYENKHYY
jgi:benzoate/toluate 1,2-dioxygenase reductase subunit